jgi:hypothetical protein
MARWHGPWLSALGILLFMVVVWAQKLLMPWAEVRQH